MAAKGTDRSLLLLLRGFISVVSDGLYEEIYRYEREFPFALYLPAACNGKKLKRDVGHHHTREFRGANPFSFLTTGQTMSSHNSLKDLVGSL
jgi:hypothetical protein